MKLALLNTTIITSEGTFECRTISREEAVELLNSNELDSYIGHHAAAQVFSSIAPSVVPVNRAAFEQAAGQSALCIKMGGAAFRVPEGAILSIEEMEEIGYTFKMLTRTA